MFGPCPLCGPDHQRTAVITIRKRRRPMPAPPMREQATALLSAPYTTGLLVVLHQGPTATPLGVQCPTDLDAGDRPVTGGPGLA
jgi:hypothetical protein